MVIQICYLSTFFLGPTSYSNTSAGSTIRESALSDHSGDLEARASRSARANPRGSASTFLRTSPRSETSFLSKKFALAGLRLHLSLGLRFGRLSAELQQHQQSSGVSTLASWSINWAWQEQLIELSRIKILLISMSFVLGCFAVHEWNQLANYATTSLDEHKTHTIEVLQEV